MLRVSQNEMIGNDVMDNINYELLAIRVIESNLTFKD